MNEGKGIEDVYEKTTEPELNIIEALMYTGECSETDAMLVLEEARESIAEGADPELILEELGLEPDYLLPLLDAGGYLAAKNFGES